MNKKTNVLLASALAAFVAVGCSKKSSSNNSSGGPAAVNNPPAEQPAPVAATGACHGENGCPSLAWDETTTQADCEARGGTFNG